MRVVQLMGRGVDGCGVTRYAIEFEKYLQRKGYEFVTVAIDDKKWSRKKAHSFLNLKTFRLMKEAELNSFHKEIHGDILIVESLPPKGSDQKIIDAFNKAVSSFTGKKVLIQHDHGVHSMRRNMCMKETTLASDYVFAHSTTDSDFCRIVRKEYSSSNLFDDGPTITIHNFQPGLDFDELKSSFWKDIKEQDEHHHKWIGRTTSWKGIELMFEFSKSLSSSGKAISFEGLDKGPAYIAVKANHSFTEELDPEVIDMKLRKGKIPTVFGAYIHDPLMERLSKCGFGYQLSRLEPRFIEHSIEYTHCEIVAVGVIPVFRKSYFDSCTHKKTGNIITKDKDTGTIFLSDDPSDWQNTINTINALENDSILRDEWRHKAFEYYKAHQNADDTYDHVMKVVLT